MKNIYNSNNLKGDHFLGLYGVQLGIQLLPNTLLPSMQGSKTKSNKPVDLGSNLRIANMF